MRGAGFLTKEERLVLVTLSICLLGGALFQLANSLFELPEEIALPERGNAPEGTGVVLDGSSPPEETVATGEGAGAQHSRPYGAKPLTLSAKLDLNKATSLELEALPGIGPALAKRIIERRKAAGGFGSVEDLLRVRGIGKKTLARFRQWVYVSSPK